MLFFFSSGFSSTITSYFDGFFINTVFDLCLASSVFMYDKFFINIECPIPFVIYDCIFLCIGTFGTF